MDYRDVPASSRLVLTAFSRFVCALDVATGQEVWRREIGDYTNLGVRIDVTETEVVALAAGRVHVLDLASGQSVREITLPPVDIRGPTSMLRVGATLYVSRAGVLTSVDLAEGTVRWTNTLPRTGHGAAAIAVPGLAVQGDITG
jgi:outer membrane protein assembly factor BamB